MSVGGIKGIKNKGGRRIQQNTSPEVGERPIVSVITAVYNGESTIGRCIESVLRQDFPEIEHIIIDGGSCDRTVDVIREYEDRIALWISEPDDGVYDAWNKGLRLARGEWISFLGADDVYLLGAIRGYMQLALRNPEAEYLSSVVRWEHSGGYVRLIGESWNWPRFLNTMCTAHPGSMHKSSLYTKYGMYDTSYKITADYEFLLRAKSTLSAAYMPTATVVMRAGGMSDSFRALREASKARVITGGESSRKAALDLQIAILKRIAGKTLLGSRGLFVKLLQW